MSQDCPGRAIGLPLDLASLDSVRQFSELFAALHLPLDLLINNGASNAAQVAVGQGDSQHETIVGVVVQVELLLNSAVSEYRRQCYKRWGVDYRQRYEHLRIFSLVVY